MMATRITSLVLIAVFLFALLCLFVIVMRRLKIYLNRGADSDAARLESKMTESLRTARRREYPARQAQPSSLSDILTTHSESGAAPPPIPGAAPPPIPGEAGVPPDPETESLHKTEAPQWYERESEFDFKRESEPENEPGAGPEIQPEMEREDEPEASAPGPDESLAVEIPDESETPGALPEAAAANSDGSAKEIDAVVRQLRIACLLGDKNVSVAVSEDLPPGRLVELKNRKRALILPPGAPLDVMERCRRQADYLIVVPREGEPLLCRSISDFIADALFQPH